MNINVNEKTYTLNEETITKIKNLINLILKANENQEFINKLLDAEKDEIDLISNLLEILSDFDNCILNLTPIQNFYILVYMKNTFPKYKMKPKMKNVPFLEEKILRGIKFYLYFNFERDDNLFNKIKKIYDEIIPNLFDLTLVVEHPKNFLINVYNNIFLPHLNSQNNITDNNFLMKFIYSYENFSRIYLIYIYKNEEMNIIFKKYYQILNICYKNTKEIIPEKRGSLINQCIISFAKTTILSLESFIKTKIFYVSSKLTDKNKKEERFNFLDNKYIFEFINYCFYLDGDNNNFSFGLEYAGQNDKKFEFILCKGKGVLIELLTVIIKKLSKFEIFKDNEFNTKILKLFCNIVEYLIKFYQKGDYPREKAMNNSQEITQLSTIVKIINFIEEIIGNNIYHELIETNNYLINSNNKYEKYSDIFKYIIVPNLLRTDLEKTYFDFQKDDYIKNLFDMIQNCQIKLPKQQSIKLLMTMCENIDEFLSYIVHVYVYILKNISLNNNTKSGSSNIKIEQKYENLYYFLTKNIDTFNLFEQALQVLCSLYYIYWDKNYLSDFFCDEIDIINYMLIKITDPFLKSKLCLFYSLSLEILFHNDDEVLSKSFDDSINFIFECIFTKIPSLQKTAFYCLNQIIFSNYLKKFCVTSIRIYTLKIINYFNNKENLIGFEDEFNDFLKGIIKEYIYDLDDSTIQLFELFWNKFYEALHNNLNKDKSSEINFGILKDKTTEVNEASEISNQINIINNFVKMICNKNIEIKNNIYEKILKLFPNLISYIGTDFEEEILDLIAKIILDIKLLPDSYFQYLLNYINCFNNISNRLEKYHIDFFFRCIQCFKIDLILKSNIKEILIKQLNIRLMANRRGIPLKKIFSEHYIYCDLGLCIELHFFGDLSKENIIELISLFYQRMEKIPNTDYELNIKLCLNIFILLLKVEDYDIFDEIFLVNKKVNLYIFLNKVISFFPVYILSLVEQQIVAIFCATIIRYLLLKQKNNQDVLICDKINAKIIGNNFEKIYFYIIKLNLRQLDLIKKKSLNILKKMEQQEEMKRFKLTEKKIIINTYEINEKNGKEHFKKNKEVEYSEREPHDKSIKNQNQTKDDENSDNNSVDYFDNEDEFLIINEYNKKFKNENNNDDNDYNDENINPDEDDENNDDEYEDKENQYDNDEDDRDQDFLTLKNNFKNSFLQYYHKYANEKLVLNLREINEFKLFEIMMKDIELNDKNILNDILDKLNKALGKNILDIIKNYKGIQKIFFPDKNIFSYRKIVKIIKK